MKNKTLPVPLKGEEITQKFFPADTFKKCQ